MKKLLKVSFVAMLAAGPVAAFAAPLTYVNQAGTAFNATTKPESITASNTVATKSYVQGAYNVLAEAINNEDAKTGSLNSLGSNFETAEKTDLATAVNAAMNAAKAAAAGNGLDTAGVKSVLQSATSDGLEYTNDELKVKLQNDSGLALDTTGVALSADTKTSLGKADTALQSGADLGAGSVAKTALATGVQSSLDLADSALQSDSALNGANLTAGTVAETALTTELQNKIDGALQSADLDLSGYALTTYVDAQDSATLQSAQTYTDSKRVQVVDTWGSETTSKVALVSAGE